MPKIDFILDNLPDNVYDKKIESNLYKILSSLARELDIFLEEMDKVKKSRFVDDASGEDLDRIARILNLTRILNESDEKFRGRIKSRVPLFIGGGSLTAIKDVIRNFLGVEPLIIEHYKSGDNLPYFDKGVLNGLISVISSGLVATIKKGVAYINGQRILFTNDSNITLPANTTSYVFIKSNNTFVTRTSITENSDDALIATIITNATNITSITDKRVILNPKINYLTNIATITVQIPYDFNSGTITYEDTVEILDKTKAAGVAVLLKVIETYNDRITITENIDFTFLVGFSGVGSSNFIGGQ